MSEAIIIIHRYLETVTGTEMKIRTGSDYTIFLVAVSDEYETSVPLFLLKATHTCHALLNLSFCVLRKFALMERKIKLKSRMQVLEFVSVCVCVWEGGVCVCVCVCVCVSVHECVYASACACVCRVSVFTHTPYNADWPQEPGVWHSVPACSLTDFTSDTMS